MWFDSKVNLDTEFWPNMEYTRNPLPGTPFLHAITSYASPYSFGAAAALLKCWCSAVAMSASLLTRRMLARVVARAWPICTTSF